MKDENEFIELEEIRASKSETAANIGLCVMGICVSVLAIVLTVGIIGWL